MAMTGLFRQGQERLALAGGGFHKERVQPALLPIMPSVVRFLTILVVLAGLAVAGMVALATLVTPKKGEMSVRVPIEEPGKPAATP